MKYFGKTQNQAPLIAVVLVVVAVGIYIIGGGSAFNTPDLDVKVNGVKNYAVDASTQLERTTLTVSITNHGSSVLQISPGLQMQVIDNTGQSHPMTADYLPPGQVIGGPLGPGASWTEPIDFELSPGQTPTKFIFQPDAQSNPVEIGL